MPESLVGSRNRRGEIIPDRIRPVFLDEKDLGADPNLREAIHKALQSSKFLVVICSRRAAGADSVYVKEEIRMFKALGGGNQIFAVLIDGNPTSGDQGGSFPEPLCFRVNEVGEVDHTAPHEPLAADFRVSDQGEEGWASLSAYEGVLRGEGVLPENEIQRLTSMYRDRQKQGLLQILSGLLGVGLRELVEHDELHMARKKFRQRLTRVLAAFLLFAAISTGVICIQIKFSEKQAHSLASTRRELSSTHESLALMHVDFGEFEEAFASLERSVAINGKIYGEEESVEAVKAVAETYAKLGNSALQEGIDDIAKKFLLRAGDLFSFVYEKEETPANGLALAGVFQDLGKSPLRQGNLRQAEEYFSRAKFIAEKILAEDDNAAALGSVASSNRLLANVAEISGDIEKGKRLLEESLRANEILILEEPSNFQYRRQLSEDYSSLAALAIKQLDYGSAVEKLERALDVRSQLIASDPSSNDDRKSLAVAHANLGSAYQEMGGGGNLPRAEKQYELALEILETTFSENPELEELQDTLNQNLERIRNLERKEKGRGPDR